MARLRHDPSARGLIYEPFWDWILAGRPVTAESERHQYGGLEFWLLWMFTPHWHPCSNCGEGIPERGVRLITVALEEGLIGLSDNKEIALDDGTTKAVIQVLDEMERPPSWEWWRDHDCPCTE